MKWRTLFYTTVMCLFVAVLVSVASAATPYGWDSDTVLLDHFNGSTVGENVGTISFVPSFPELDTAGDYTHEGYTIYTVSGWYQWFSAYDPSGKEGTIEMWLLPKKWGDRLLRLQWDKVYSEPGGGDIGGLYLTADGKLEWHAWSFVSCDPSQQNCPPSSSLTGHTPIPIDQWTHVAVTWSPTKTILYVNGSPDAEIDYNLYPALQSAFYVYVDDWYHNNPGYIDELRISKVARTKFKPTIVLYAYPGSLPQNDENDCRDWQHARDLQVCLAIARTLVPTNTIQIWAVGKTDGSKGVYYPTTTSYPTATFTFLSDIELYGGFRGDETSLTQRNWITYPVTLSGDIGAPGDDSDNSHHVVTISGSGSTIVLDGVSVSGGYADDGNTCPGACGGGMYNESSSPTLTHVTFSGNSAKRGYGGGLYNKSGSPTLTDVTFSNNKPTIPGSQPVSSGECTWLGGGMYNESGSPMLTDVTFSGNFACGSGGGIYSGGSPTLTSVMFSGNYASSSGGGMYNAGNAKLISVTFSANWVQPPSSRMGGPGGGMYNTGTADLSHVAFNSNSAYRGGAMYNAGGNATLTEASFSSNRAQGISLFPPGSTPAGGGMFNEGGIVVIADASSFTNNEADYGYGGAIHNGPNGVVTIISSTLQNNSADLDGGAIFNTGVVTITSNSLLSGNMAITGTSQNPGAGGGIRNAGIGIVTIDGSSQFTNNQAQYGGGIHNDGNGRVAVKSSTFFSNSATSDGGAIANYGNGVITINDGSVLSTNNAGVSGGGFLNWDNGVVALNQVTVTNNTAWYGGGGIYNGGHGTLNIADSWISNDHTTLTDTLAVDPGGGGIRNDDAGMITIISSTLSGNHSATYGGGLHNGGGATSHIGAITITNSTLASNSADKDGGGIFNGGAGTVKIISSTIGGTDLSDANTAVSGGGILNWANGVVALNQVTVTNNIAGYGGGGIANGDHGTVTIAHSALADNSAILQGGAIVNWDNGTLTMEDTTLSGNRTVNDAPPGGGGGALYNANDTTLNNVTFNDNIANGRGGGMYNSGNPTLTNVTFEDNRAYAGGGMYNTANVAIANTLFDGNSASAPDSRSLTSGGGMYTDLGQAILTNVTFSRNDVVGWGGGTYIAGGSVTLTKSTLTNNTANPSAIAGYGGGHGAALYLADGSATLINDTISGNTAFGRSGVRGEGDGGGMYVGGGAILIQYTTVATNTAFGRGGGLYNRNSIVDVDASIIAYNIPEPDNCFGSITSSGYNVDSDGSCNFSMPGDLSGIDPRLGPLQDNGGPTWTHALLPGSQAIDRVDSDGSGGCVITITTDQRGVSRPQPAGGNCDSGAFELVKATAVVSPGQTSTAYVPPGGVDKAGASATLTNNNPASGPVTITVATYAHLVTATNIIDVGAGSVDLQVTGADISDTMVTKFYYPSTITGITETNLVLQYFTGVGWELVRSSPGITPTKDITNNLDSTVSGGRFLVTFGISSTPPITGLTGTVFAFATNVAPTVELGADVTLNEGDTLSRIGTFSDPNSISWTATVDYGDGSGIQPLGLNPDKTFVLSHIYADNGVFTVTVTVTDDNNAQGTDSLVATVNNVSPVVNAGSGATIDEGSTFAGSGSFVDPGADTWTGSVDYGDGSGVQALALNSDKTFSLTHLFIDNGTYEVVVTVTDDDGGIGSDSLVVTVNNIAPTVGAITAPADPVKVNIAINASAAFTDPGMLDTHTAIWDWGDGNTSPGVVTETSGSGTVFGSHAYMLAGIYTVTLTVMDRDGASGRSVFQPVIVFGPSAGFVIGGGWVKDGGTLAPFGFAARYVGQSNTLVGEVAYIYRSGATFVLVKSQRLQWLVVTGNTAIFHGTAKVNGVANYTFEITVVDNGHPGTRDTFAIKIWRPDGTPLHALPASRLSGGNITILNSESH